MLHLYIVLTCAVTAADELQTRVDCHWRCGIVTDVGELEMRELQSWCITLHLFIVTDVGELRELQNRGASLYTC